MARVGPGWDASAVAGMDWLVTSALFFAGGLLIGMALGVYWFIWQAKRLRRRMEASAKDYVSRFCAEMYLRHVTDVPRTWGAMVEQEVGDCRCGQCRAYDEAVRKGLN